MLAASLLALSSLVLLIRALLQPLLSLGKWIWRILEYAFSLLRNSPDSTRNFLRRLCLLINRKLHRLPYIIRIPANIYASRTIVAICFMTNLGLDLSSAILIDTGCSQHMFRSKEMFISYQTLPESKRFNITGIGETSLQPIGYGDIHLRLRVLSIERELILTNALHVPDLKANLVSGSQLIDNRARITLENSGCNIEVGGELIAHAFRKSGLFLIDTWNDHNIGLAQFRDEIFGHPAYSGGRSPAERLWHERLGHISPRNLRKLAKISRGINLDHMPDLEDCTCEACLLGRMQDVPHKESLVDGKTKPYEVIFSDVKGPMSVTGHEGSRYFVTFQDAVNKTSEVYLMKYKAEVPFFFHQYRRMIERKGGPIRRLHSDGGGEYLGSTFQLELANEGIKFSYSTAYSQQQNGASERLNRTIHDRAFTFMSNSSLPENMWPEAVKHANWIRNLLPTADSDTQTPYMRETDEKFFDFKWIRTWGCNVSYRSGSQKRFKSYVDAKSKPGHLVGYESRHVLRIRDLGTGHVIRASAVHVQEKSSTVPGSNKRKLQEQFEEEDEDDTPLSTEVWFEDETPPPDQATLRKQERQENIRRNTENLRLKRIRKGKSDDVRVWKSKRLAATNGPVRPHEFSEPVNLKDQPSALAFSALAVFATPSFKDIYSMLANSPEVELYEPTSWKQATRSVEKEKWYHASEEEIKSLDDNRTYTLVDRPTSRKVLDARWVFKYKRNSEGNIIRYKARWVVKGYEQQSGVDFNETFASVVKPMSYKALFAIAAAHNWEIEQMDVKTAFLYGNVEEEIFVNQPEGFEDGTDKVCRLNKALYGLKQSPRVWYQTLSDFLQELGFKPLHADASVFVRDSLFVAVYVDDLLLFGPDIIEIDIIKTLLNSRFSMTDLGPVAHYLGMKVTRDRVNRKLHLSQHSYLETAIRRAGLWDCAPHLTPIATTRLEHAAADYYADSLFKARYQSLVGTLMYAMLGTRPDIAYAVSLVSRFASCRTNSLLPTRHSQTSARVSRRFDTPRRLHRCSLGRRSRYSSINLWFYL